MCDHFSIPWLIAAYNYNIQNIASYVGSFPCLRKASEQERHNVKTASEPSALFHQTLYTWYVAEEKKEVN